MKSYASLRSRLLDYAASRAPEHGVHESMLARIVDKVLELHPGDERHSDMMLLKSCINSQMAAEETACDLKIVLELLIPWEDEMYDRVDAELEQRGFTDIGSAIYLGYVHFMMRSILPPEEARAEVLAAFESVATEPPSWTVMNNNVDAIIAVPGSERAFQPV